MTTAQLAPPPIFRGFDNNGNPLSGGFLYTYAAGTSTLQASYPTSSQITPNTNPIVLNTRGECALWLDPTLTYKLQLTDNLGNTIPGYPVDNIPGGINITATTIGQALYPRSPSEILASVIPTNWQFRPNNVRRYNAQGNGLTDDTAAFNVAAQVLIYSGELYIPAASPTYYRLNSTITFTGLPPGAFIHGDGNSSIVVPANTAGTGGFINNGNIHLCYQDFGVYGTISSGNNFDSINAAHYPDYINVWSGFASNACFKNTQGICARFDHCQADDNNAFRPITLIGGLTEGRPNYGFWIPSDAGALNNNPTFTACRANAVGGICSVQIGTTGGVPVQSAFWNGGLIQGSSVFTELYLVTQDSEIDAHIEPPGGNTVGWVVTMDGCTNTTVHNCVVEGDARFINSCVNSGFEHITGAGFDIGVGSVECFIRDVNYGNITSGPASGLIKDRGTNTDLRRLQNSSSANVAVGDNTRDATTYFQTNMQEWVGGGAPTVPCGFVQLGGGTITQSTGEVYSGTYSCESAMAGTNLTEGIATTIGPGNLVAGKNVTVEAWVYNVTTAGLAYIQAVEGTTGSAYQQASFQAGVWERMFVTFSIGASATSVQLNFTGLVGTVYWGPIKITLEDFTPLSEFTTDTTAAPNLSYPNVAGYGGYPVRRVLIPASATAITSFSNPHYGQWDFVWTGNRTLTNNSVIIVTGGTVAGTAGLTKRMTYGSDGIMRQI